jgi:hypothetical protein
LIAPVSLGILIQEFWRLWILKEEIIMAGEEIIMAEKSLERGQAAGQQRPSAPTRIMAKNMGVYYSNCTMIATSPRDLSVYFGRYVPGSNEKGEQSIVELYEHQIYMTLGQAEDLARILSQTLKAIKMKAKEGSAVSART